MQFSRFYFLWLQSEVFSISPDRILSIINPEKEQSFSRCHKKDYWEQKEQKSAVKTVI